jgi:hypothetical protein
LDGHHASDFLTSGALEGYATQSWVNSNYLPTSALTGYATQSWVNSNYLPTSTALVNTLAKSADGSMKFSGRNFADTYVDFSHDHRWEEIVDRPNIEIGGYGMTYTDGKFGVGIKVPSYPIDVDGSIRATSFVNSSDARLKDNPKYAAHMKLIELFRESSESKTVSLERNKRLAQMREEREMRKAEEAAELGDDEFADDELATGKDKDAGKDDVVLAEAFNILADLVKLTGGNEAPDTPDVSTSAFWSIFGGQK